MLAISEALLVDQARADDRIETLRGAQPTAEVQLRALLAGHPVVTEEPSEISSAIDSADEDVEVATITDFASWVRQTSAASRGAG